MVRLAYTNMIQIVCLVGFPIVYMIKMFINIVTDYLEALVNWKEVYIFNTTDVLYSNHRAETGGDQANSW